MEIPAAALERDLFLIPESSSVESGGYADKRIHTVQRGRYGNRKINYYDRFSNIRFCFSFFLTCFSQNTGLPETGCLPVW